MKCPNCGKRMRLVENKVEKDTTVLKIVEEKPYGGELITRVRKVWECICKTP